MNPEKINAAVERLENNLPLRQVQAQLPQDLRRFHQSILRFYLESGRAPTSSDFETGANWVESIEKLSAAKIIVTDGNGGISGAYPFVNEAREFSVFSQYGMVNAMCAFDALAVSSMFNLPTRIESRCRVSGREIVIEQENDALKVLEPDAQVFAAIDWGARDSGASCSASLCLEMMFICGQDNGAEWQTVSTDTRELFELDEAHAFICAVFVPLMQARPAIAGVG